MFIYEEICNSIYETLEEPRTSRKLNEKKFLADILEGIEDIDLYTYNHDAFFKANKKKFKKYFLNDPYWALAWAEHIDEKPTPTTRNVACRDPYAAYRYALDIDEKPRDDTRTAACGDPDAAVSYAEDVDELYSDETFRAVLSGDPITIESYINQVFGARTKIATLLKGKEKALFE